MTLAAIKNPAWIHTGFLSCRDELFVHHVHSYFKAETHFGSSWFSPHNDLLFISRTDPMSGSCECIIDRMLQKPAIADHEQDLGKFMKAPSCK